MSATLSRWSIVVAVVAVLGVAAWVGASAWQASMVGVSSTELVECADPESIVPAGERLQADTDPQDRTDASQAVWMDQRLDCVLRTQVVSSADVAIEVERLEWPLLGPESGMGASLSWAVQGGPELVPDAYGGKLDAVFDTVGFGAIEAGESEHFAVRARFNGTCNSPGEGGVANSPIATIQVLGLSHTVRATGHGVGLKVADGTECDDTVDAS
ncbi:MULTISPECIES: hypothetical protein [Aeromicrobium]|uniref:hypothetical protein n=1 Tax=Aeromicrobium TaxID=2040 RepID=UPI00257F0CEE|nr:MULTISPECIES: hypothetical protein [Aeromicrobium]